MATAIAAASKYTTMVLTTKEFDIVYNTALCSFAEKSKQEMQREIYGTLPCGHDADRLWLYVYALNTWDNTDGASNYLSEAQMLRIVSKVQQHGV